MPEFDAKMVKIIVAVAVISVLSLFLYQLNRLDNKVNTEPKKQIVYEFNSEDD